MFKNLYPDYRFSSVYAMPKDFFESKGIKYVLFDIDNTLIAYTSEKADGNVRSFLGDLTDRGIKYAFVSNNHKERVSTFAGEFGAVYVNDALKPLLFGVKKAMAELGARKENTALVGDQIFTDVWAGKRAGAVTVLVNPIEAKETPFFGIKRRLEKIVLGSGEKK